MVDLAGISFLTTGASWGIDPSVALCMAEAGADEILWGAIATHLLRLRPKSAPLA
jgi:hypothetical protein